MFDITWIIWKWIYPIYDIFDMYQKIPDILFDLDCLSQSYLKKFELREEEKLIALLFNEYCAYYSIRT